jgi:hypothetical protein
MALIKTYTFENTMKKYLVNLRLAYGWVTVTDSMDAVPTHPLSSRDRCYMPMARPTMAHDNFVPCQKW